MSAGYEDKMRQGYELRQMRRERSAPDSPCARCKRDACPAVCFPLMDWNKRKRANDKEKLLAAGVQAQVSGDPNSYLFAMGLKLAEKIVDGMNTIVPAEGGGEDG